MAKRLISILLALSMFLSIVFVATSCKNNNQNNEKENETGDDSVYDVLSDETFEGATFTVLAAAEQWKEAYVVEDQSDVLRAAQYNMYNKIMDRYDIKLEHSIMHGLYMGLSSVRDALYQSVVSGSMDYDLFAAGQAYGYSRVSDGTLLNLDETGIDFTKEWWAQYVNEDLRISDYQLLVSGYYSLTNLSGSMVTYYNPEIAETYHLSNIYDVVRSGDWTYEELNKRCKAVMTDVNGDGNYTLSEDIVGLAAPDNYLAQTAVSAGYNICVHNEDGTISINTNLEKLYELTTRNHDLIDGKLCLAAEDGNSIPSFSEGHSLLMYAQLSAADASEIRNMADYTVIPMPKYDTDQREYHTPVVADVCGIPLNVKNQNMSEALLEALNCYSYYELRNVYLNLILKDKYSKDQNMEDMIDICLENPDTEFSYICAELFGTDLFFCTVWKGRNIASWLKSYKRVYEKKLESLYDTLLTTYN